MHGLRKCVRPSTCWFNFLYESDVKWVECAICSTSIIAKKLLQRLSSSFGSNSCMKNWQRTSIVCRGHCLGCGSASAFHCPYTHKLSMPPVVCLTRGRIALWNLSVLVYLAFLKGVLSGVRSARNFQIFVTFSTFSAAEEDVKSWRNPRLRLIGFSVRGYPDLTNLNWFELWLSSSDKC